ncbi:leucine--tRNA ligase [Coxiella burnetii]|uniref:Leucine--tRNA ligase n=1 Tax=Coxiella burnetii (strain Dugway 5J108-111) TaxID=434922 RepID=SYL_COXBN|nr:leucine--tRNA ligase [Coxiella burnetii]A9KCQ4.1 RecName: Full=Leucine--tRNA ligase; AltName: Full=Leucyl-tRNA synthetase; Short=LeuRS [Coxiella burnetii Dugway 5J108-111]ABS77100.1 leucyl-tRNA synthetase [Coxiella burnetii Dugway 5J108-111]OYK79808.1 leucine--tRNA ligase [Coxiella burnetii]OYK81890.1 leucine--tRNA ligase [Coxiella burnetii]
MNESYQPTLIEQLAQEYWEENETFEVKEDLSREKFYCLSMLPYPSGDLHMGHVRNYTIGDVIARYQIHKGRNVLQPMGWDAFGLPAENAAIQRELPPAEWTRKNIKKMRKQLKQLGFAYDWSREITTCDSTYYRWEQWLFLQLYKKGLAYKKNAIVNWDPVDQTVLANEQIVDGRGWRSGAVVERREISQWFLKITDYSEELLKDLDELKEWPEQVITMQRNWIGQSQGVIINFNLEKGPDKLQVYTTRPDTLMGVTYLAIAPEHPLAKERAKKSKKIAAFLKKCKQTRVAEADIATQEKEGIDSGLFAVHPLSKEKLPIWIANFVLMEYASGVVMAVPAHDERDHEFALKYDLPLKPVIEPADGHDWDYNQAAYTNPGKLINSGSFNDIDSKTAFNVIADYLKNNGAGSRQTHYRLRDWGISRQRYWGTPIPIIYCKTCGTVPVPENQLPVLLPEDIIPTGHGSPLKETASFYKTRCPVCNKPATRETDTMDTFVESSWYYARYSCPDQDKVMLDDRAKYWTPVDQYIGGIEHAVMHLLYARFMHKILRDLGLLNSNEPFIRLLTQGMVLKDGAKMSKSKGNVVTPQSLIKKYGADTVRLFIIFAAPPEQDLEWSDSGVEGAYRFLKKLWGFSYRIKDALLAVNQQKERSNYQWEAPEHRQTRQQIHECLQQANIDMERLQFNTVVSAVMKILNILIKLTTDNDAEAHLIREGTGILLRLLSPITPHISHHLWQSLGFGGDILDTPWPRPDPKALQTTELELIVQINGKLRGRIQVPTEASKEIIESTALNQENVQRHLADKKIKKVIVVPKKLINIVV